MHNLFKRTGVVHWLGAGLSTGTGLNKIASTAQKTILWNRTKSKADALITRLGLSEKVETRAYALDILKSSLQEGDIIVCMLPVAEHPTILQTAIDHQAHYVSSSYVNDIIKEKAKAAQEKGLAVLVEAGLDPGIDHLAAHLLVEDAKEKIQSLDHIDETIINAQFFSYCGGFPEIPNDFKYKFSWAPAGVLLALRSPANYIKNSQEETAPRPWEKTTAYKTAAGDFEAYPNRDSVPFIQQYHLPENWKIQDFVRGTLRLEGWLNAWDDVFETIKTGSEEDVKALGGELATQHFYAENDNDRVVLTVGLRLTDQHNTILYDHHYEMDIIGDETDSAMALTVSNGVACGIVDLLEGHTNVGLNRAAEDKASVLRWTKRLENWGISLRKR